MPVDCWQGHGGGILITATKLEPYIFKHTRWADNTTMMKTPLILKPSPELEIKNKTVMAPMTRCGATREGSPTEDLANYYTRRAKGGVGLIILEGAAINDSDAMAYRDGLQFHSETHQNAWKGVIRDVHDLGGKIWIQLFHAGRLTVPEISGVHPVAPSAIEPFDGESYWRPRSPDGTIINFQTNTSYPRPKALAKQKIGNIIDQFAASCALAENAGFNGVELHGAHGYLLHQFAHAQTNTRDDEYQASTFLFARELVSACRKKVSAAFTLSYRLSLHMVDNSFVRYDEVDLDFGPLIKMLDDAGIDVFHSSELKGGHPMFGEEMPLCELIKRHTSKPVIVCGSISGLDAGEHLLQRGIADLIAFGRPLITHPDLISEYESGAVRPLRKFNYQEHMFPIQ